MKTFKQFRLVEDLLLEYNEEKTWNNFGKKIVNHLNTMHKRGDSHFLSTLGATMHQVDSDESKSPEEKTQVAATGRNLVMKHLEDADPTNNKEYVPHIARIVAAGGINRAEDLHARMRGAINSFHQIKRQLPAENRDVGKIKGLGELEGLVDQHKHLLDAKSGKQQKKAVSKEMEGQATIHHDNDEVKVIEPHTVAAAAHYGQGTRWCTATTDPDHSMFNHYNKDGPMKIYIPKTPAYPGEKYQIHNASGQYMNERDEPVDVDHIAKRFPSIPHPHQELMDNIAETEKSLKTKSIKDVTEKDIKDYHNNIKTLDNKGRGEIDWDEPEDTTTPGKNTQRLIDHAESTPVAKNAFDHIAHGIAALHKTNNDNTWNNEDSESKDLGTIQTHLNNIPAGSSISKHILKENGHAAKFLGMMDHPDLETKKGYAEDIIDSGNFDKHKKEISASLGVKPTLDILEKRAIKYSQNNIHNENHDEFDEATTSSYQNDPITDYLKHASDIGQAASRTNTSGMVSTPSTRFSRTKYEPVHDILGTKPDEEITPKTSKEFQAHVLKSLNSFTQKAYGAKLDEHEAAISAKKAHEKAHPEQYDHEMYYGDPKTDEARNLESKVYDTSPRHYFGRGLHKDFLNVAINSVVGGRHTALKDKDIVENSQHIHRLVKGIHTAPNTGFGDIKRAHFDANPVENLNRATPDQISQLSDAHVVDMLNSGKHDKSGRDKLINSAIDRLSEHGSLAGSHFEPNRGMKSISRNDTPKPNLIDHLQPHIKTEIHHRLIKNLNNAFNNNDRTYESQGLSKAIATSFVSTPSERKKNFDHIQFGDPALRSTTSIAGNSPEWKSMHTIMSRSVNQNTHYDESLRHIENAYNKFPEYEHQINHFWPVSHLLKRTMTHADTKDALEGAKTVINNSKYYFDATKENNDGSRTQDLNKHNEAHKENLNRAFDIIDLHRDMIKNDHTDTNGVKLQNFDKDMSDRIGGAGSHAKAVLSQRLLDNPAKISDTKMGTVAALRGFNKDQLEQHAGRIANGVREHIKGTVGFTIRGFNAAPDQDLHSPHYDNFPQEVQRAVWDASSSTEKGNHGYYLGRKIASSKNATLTPADHDHIHELLNSKMHQQGLHLSTSIVSGARYNNEAAKGLLSKHADAIVAARATTHEDIKNILGS